jgi:serine/threonine protein kinase
VPRDIKPENIFFGQAGDMKLGDFGLAIDAKAERPKSRVGTLDYMAPEVVCLPTADERRRMERDGRPLREADMPTYSDKVDTWAVGGGAMGRLEAGRGGGCSGELLRWWWRAFWPSALLPSGRPVPQGVAKLGCRRPPG